MITIGIILGSTRPERLGDAIGRWVHEAASTRGDARFQLIDLAGRGIDVLDEAVPPMAGCYAGAHTRAWADTVAPLDAFVFVTPEYNHSIPGALKTAIDFLFAEWGDKAAGVVGYGPTGALRAVEHLRLVLAEVGVATVRPQVALTFPGDFDSELTFRPTAASRDAVHALLDDVVRWAAALAPLRCAQPAVGAP